MSMVFKWHAKILREVRVVRIGRTSLYEEKLRAAHIEGLTNTRSLCVLWRNVLIQAEEIVRVVCGLNGPQALPSMAIRLRDSVAFVPTHEIHINAGDHCRTQAAEQISRPGDVGSVVCRFDPVAQNVDHKRRTSVPKGCLIGCHAGR